MIDLVSLQEDLLHAGHCSEVRHNQKLHQKIQKAVEWLAVQLYSPTVHENMMLHQDLENVLERKFIIPAPTSRAFRAASPPPVFLVVEAQPLAASIVPQR